MLNLMKKYYYSVLGLILGIPFILVFVIAPFDRFLEKGILKFSTRALIYLGVFIIWIIIWIFLKQYFPKTKKNKIGFIIAIKTENDKQKLLIKNDFADKVKELLRTNNLLSLFDTIILQDYKAEKAWSILKDYSDKRSEYIREDKFQEFSKTKENKTYEKLNNKIKGHFYIWGSIKLRKDNEPTYFITFDAVVVHRPIPIKASTKIAKDFLSVFPKGISFREKMEVGGFETASQYISIAVRYMTGVAAFISGNVFVSYKLHKGLPEEIDKIKLPQQNLEVISKSLKEYLFLELFFQSKYFYEKKKDLNKFQELLAEAEKISAQDYHVLVLNSVKAFVIDREPLKSLQYLRKASKVNQGDYTWLFNKAFIYMYLEKFEYGDKDYKRLRGLTFPGEEIIVDQCIAFNEELLINESSKKQSLYILGYLQYVKKNNLPLALEKFEEFLSETEENLMFDYLRVRAITYIGEIKKDMKL